MPFRQALLPRHGERAHSSAEKVAVRVTSSASRKGPSDSTGGTTSRFFASRKK